MQLAFINRFIPKKRTSRILGVITGVCSIFAIITIFQVPYLEISRAQADFTNFITRSGSTLMDGSSNFRFAGGNAHWLGLLGNNNFLGSNLPGFYPTHFMIDDAFATAQEMGATVVRSHTLGISVGCNTGDLSKGGAKLFDPTNCLVPDQATLNGTWNQNAWNVIDYAIDSAKRHNIRLIIPLLDNWHFYNGGKHNFTDWNGDNNENDFYSLTAAQNDFKTYISGILNHVNQYNSLALKNDRTIMEWEIGNELDKTTNNDGTGTSTWGSTEDTWEGTIATYIKGIDANHLVGDGHQSSQGDGRPLESGQVSQSSIDMYSGHYYPPSISFMNTDATLTSSNSKVYYIGEFDWLNQIITAAQGTIAYDNTTSADLAASAKITVTQNEAYPSYYYYLQLLSPTFSLTSGLSYTVSYYAKSINSNIIQPFIETSSGTIITPATTNQKTLNSTWTQYTFTFTPSTSPTNALLAFNLAASPGTLWVDNTSVALTSGGSNLISPSSFEGTNALSAASTFLSGWTFKQNTPQPGDNIYNFLPAVVSNSNVSGEMFWDILSHDKNGQLFGFLTADTFTMNYPGINQTIAGYQQLLRTEAYQMEGLAIPAHMIPTGPKLNSVTSTASGTLTANWQGTASASMYVLQGTNNSGTTWTPYSTTLSDFYAPQTITTGTTYSNYRIVPYNLDGIPGPASNVYPALAPTATPTPTSPPTTPTAIPTPTSIPQPSGIGAPGSGPTPTPISQSSNIGAPGSGPTPTPISQSSNIGAPGSGPTPSPISQSSNIAIPTPAPYPTVPGTGGNNGGSSSGNTASSISVPTPAGSVGSATSVTLGGFSGSSITALGSNTVNTTTTSTSNGSSSSNSSGGTGGTTTAQTVHSDFTLKSLSQPTYNTKTITLLLLDSNQSPITNATISLPGSSKKLKTNASGNVLLGQMKPGTYTITISYKNLKATTKISITTDPYVKARDITLALSIQNKLSAQRISDIWKNLAALLPFKLG